MEQNSKYKLTNQQNNIYLLDSIYKDSGINNIISWLEINEIIDCSLLVKTANIIVEKNDNYRLRFNLKEIEPYQYLEQYHEFNVEVLEVENTNQLETILKQARINLEEELPFKFYIFRYPNGKGGLSGVFHHLISDAWSMSLLILQIVTLYHDLKNNIDIDNFQYPSYIQYILSQQEFLKSEKKDKNQKYWENIFKKPVDILSFKENKNTDIFFDRKEYMLDDDVLLKLRKYCKNNGISEYIFMLCIYCIYIGKIKNSQRYILGNPILNRSNAREKATSGLFMSVNPFVVDIDKNLSFLSFAKKIQQEQMEMYRHLKYDYKELIKYINEVNNNYGNVFDVVFSYQNAKVEKEKNHLETKSRWVESNKQVESLMIHLKDTDDTGGILFAYDYLTSVFSKNDIDLMHSRIENIITQVLDNIFIKDIELVTPNEKDMLIKQYNDTYYEYNKNETIVSLFEKACVENRDKIALIFEDYKLDYNALNKRANQLARVLSNIGVISGDIVTIADSRSIEMIVSMLAVLKIGATYLPIDIEYPKDRIEYIMKNANSQYCITREKYRDRFDMNGKKIFSDDEKIYTLLDENLYTYIHSSNLAYMIYTSGSTGNPKGVMITHQNVVNFINGTSNIIDFNNKTIVSVTTISFDIFVLESWLCLSKGTTVVIANENEQNIPIYLNKLCLKHNVNMIQTTPSRMQILMSDKDNNEFLSKMSDIMIGGENVPYRILENIRSISKAKIYNMYGPTETTVWSTIKDLSNDTKITIGKPIANTQVYIFDNDMKLCPINVEGNIYIGGDGLSNGYYNNITLTNEKFIHNPYIYKQYMYNTGDIGKWNNDGMLECLGRNDFQVKLHGHRIELEEIESQILKFKDIREASVVFVDNTAIYAYYTSDVDVSSTDLKKHLQSKLPLYMIPSRFVQIENMPKTPNGKTDKKTLQNIKCEEKSNINVEVRMLKTDTEKEILKLIEEILDKKFENIDQDIFGLGMDSLNIIGLCNQIIKKYNVNITVKDIFDLKTISNISDFIEHLSNKKDCFKQNVIPVAKCKERYQATIAQKRIYFATELSNGGLIYNMPYAIELAGKLNVAKLEKSINELIKRHVSLQISFEICDGELYQKINKLKDFKMQIEKVKGEEITKKYNEFVQSFDLSIAPLFRVKLLQITDTKNILLFDMHHIISDGTSLHVLTNEISNIYNGEKVDSIGATYIDYTEYENSMINSNSFDNEKVFWKEQFEDVIENLDMPYDFKNANVNDYKGAKVHSKLDKNIYRKIQQLAMENEVTTYMILFSVYYILLSRYTQKSDIIVGIPIINRPNDNFKNTIGLYANDLPLRVRINEVNTFRELLQYVKRKLLDVVNNSAYPSGEILSLLKTNNNDVGNRLFDTLFIFQNNDIPTLKLNNIATSPYLVDIPISKYNFSLEIIDKKIENEYAMNIEYLTSLFKESTINIFVNHYINILNEILENIDIKLSEVQLISEQEKNKLLYENNNTKHIIDVNEPIHKMISRQAQLTPNETAIIFEDKKLTFNQLEELTNSLAIYLRKQGICPNDIVGIMVPRSLEMLVGIIGILKAGAAYMPIDITYPQDRITYMLNNSKTKYVLVNQANIKMQNAIDITLENKTVYNNKGKVDNVNNGEDIAYLIYTSGSTGNPKGVMVKHKGITNLVHYANDNVEFLKDEIKRNIVSVTTMSFDIFVFETLIALQKGLSVVIANEDEQRIPSKLNTLIEKNNVEIIQTTPSRMQMLVEYKKDIPSLSSIKYVVLAGEQYTDSLFKNIIKINPNVISYNGYGPSETTIFSTLTLVKGKDKINIGKPLYNTQMYVLDKQKRLVPANHIGELYIGGMGLSKGYINNKALTDERFVENPYNKGEYIYQTGDLSRVLENGEFECLGRTDSQVKIRGLRIELEEIENIIINSNLVDKAVVIDKIDMQGRQYLSAYFTANDIIKTQDIRECLEKRLPSYMIPTHIQQVDSFQYTPNGKIDKKVLRSIIDSKIESINNVVLPKTQLQEKMVKIYKNILGQEKIGITDGFFELGGDSILAMKLQIELIKLDINVTYADIFNFPTIEQLEQRILYNKQKEVSKIKIGNYDKVLNNTIKEVDTEKSNIKNVLLIGATGFVGIHVLSKLIDDNVEKIYCLVREKEDKLSINRLKDKLHFYFSTKYDKFIGNRIIILNGNITDVNFGMKNEEYMALGENINVVINASAKVSHYGNEEEFNKINVVGVQNIVQFCKENNKKIFHISTMSVSGNALVDQTYIENNIKGQVIFKENNLYVNQPLDNVYIKTKFIGEQTIFENILTGLDGYVLRLGNIMGRYSDGLFQDNIQDNAYTNRLKAIYNLGVIPNYIEKGYLEFTPVDYCAQAIVNIIYNNNNVNRVFHLFNDKHITVSDFIQLCNQLYKKIDIVDELTFNNILKELLKKDDYQISYLLNDMGKNNRLQYESNIKLNADFTNKYLARLGFEWPNIDKEYLKKFFDYLFGVNFFRKE